MSLFMIETETASSGASQISSVGTQVSTLGSTVGGYDISCEDGFDFGTARGVLANNIEACATKMQNTSKIIESVVSSHTELQNSLKFDSPADSSDLEDVEEEQEFDDENAGDEYVDSGYSSYGGGYDGGGYGSAAVPAVGAAAVAANNEEEDKFEAKEDVEFDGEEEPETELIEESTAGLVTTALSSSGYAYLEKDYISEDTKSFISNSQFSYDDNGYAKYGDYYVISCDSSVGKVGDVIQFKQKDGSVVDCIVGVNTTSSRFKGAVNFIVKQDATQVKPLDFARNLITDNDTVTNLGDIKSLDKNKVISTDNPTTPDTTSPASTQPETTVPTSTESIVPKTTIPNTTETPTYTAISI